MSKLIDSPFEVCPVCDEYVFLDQTQRQCAQEHHCENIECPLARFFEGKEVEGASAVDTEKESTK
jgi:hypothetical protein